MSEQQQDAAQQAVDRKSMLAQQFDEVEETVKAGTDKVQAAQPAQSDAAQRARDEAGKFVAKKADATAAQPAKQQAQALLDSTAQPQPWEKAPKSWKKDYWDGWATLPENYRQYIHDREAQMRAGAEPLVPKAELADKINQVAEPYMNTIRGLGLDLPKAVEGLMRVDHELRTLPPQDRLQRLVQIGQSYGIDLTGQAQQARVGDPNIQAVQNELLGIKGQFSNFLQQQEAQQQRAALDEVQKFGANAEHFEDAKPVMIKLLQSGMADSLPEAYEKAIRLDPDLFDKVQSAKQASADAEKRQTADIAAKRAKAAAVSVKSATPGTQKQSNAQDRRSMLREQLDSLSERL